MKRRLEPVDLAVAVGVVATVLAAQLFWTAANGGIGGPNPVGAGEMPASAIATAMQWLQPALGRTIVEQSVVDRTDGFETQTAASQFVQAVTAAQIASSSQPMDGIIGRARGAEDAEASRVQYVLGQMIVSGTLRGVRNDLVSATHIDGSYNRRLIALAGATAERMAEQFRNNRQQNLGQAIVAASVGHLQSIERNQQRLGTAVVRLAQVQKSFNEATRAAEEQKAAITVAILRTQALVAGSEQLAKAEPMAANAPVSARALPEIPFSLIAAGSAAVVLIFFVGLMVPSRHEEFDADAGERAQSSGSYRRTG
jgi:hypothetical protein